MNSDKLRTYLREQGYDGILLRNRQNFSWLTNGQHNHIVQSTPEGVADLVVMIDKVFLVTSKMEERRILEEECCQLPFEIEVITDDWYKDMTPCIEEIGKGKNMATDTVFSNWSIVQDDLIELRSTLAGAEIDRYRTLCRETAKALEGVCHDILPGQTEHEIAALVAGKLIMKGIRIQVLLVASDDRIYKYRHPIPTDKPVEKHVMIVICAENHGLVASVTRLIHFGKLSEEFIENISKLARIDAVMNEATRPGVRMSDVFKAGIKQYEKAGYPDDWKKLHQGGLTGFASRELIATPHTNGIVKVNQAYAWNPSLPGMKSEDTMLVTKNGVDFLTHTGNWDYINVEVNGKVYQRPDILIRDI